MTHLAEARETVEPIVELAEKLGYKRRVSQIYTILGHCALHIEEDYPRAFKYLEDALQIAEELDDTPSLVAAHNWLGLGLGYACEFQRCLYHLEKALEINVAANSLWAIAANKAHISSMVYNPTGKLDLAYKTTGEAVSIAEESGDIFSKAIAYSVHGNCCRFKGLLEEAEEHLLKAADFSERINDYIHGLTSSWRLGDIYSWRAEYQKAQECYQKALSLAERSCCRFFINLCRILSAKGKVMNNQRDINLNEIFRCYEENRTKMFEGLMARYIGEILLDIDDRHMNEAEEWIKTAIEADKNYCTMFDLGQGHDLYAELLKRKGDLPGAKENLAKAIEIYKECGADGWVVKTEEALAKI